MFSLLRRFLSDHGGGYAPLFAIACLPLFGTVAAAVEYSRVYQTRSHLQHALDASALATAKELSQSMDAAYLESYARDFFDANLNPNLDPADITFVFSFTQPQYGAAQVTITAGYNYDTHMAGVIGVEEMEMEVSATVAAGNKTVEVALVMDNSGSMDSYTGSGSEKRIERSQAAAVNLITQVHTVAALSNKTDPVKFAVIPFASSVNVGPQYRGADWLDMNGWSSVHHENLDWIGTSTNGDSWPDAYASGEGWKSPSTTTVSVGPNPPDPLPDGITSFNSTWLTRWTLFDALAVDWGGCVEMRPGTHNTTDSVPDNLDADTLYVPMFAPDEPDRINSNEDDDYRNSYLNDYRRVGPDYSQSSNTYGSYGEQLDRQSWTAKYNSDAPWSENEANQYSHRDRMGNRRSRDFGDWGPNQGCTTDPVQPLTTSAQTAIDAVNAMEAGGYTNVQAGLAWGWRLLSSTAPFTEGRAYSQIENDKYIVLLTDGNNTYPGQSTWNDTEYYPWGYGKDDRVREGLDSWLSETAAMNAKTATTCANIKALTDGDNEKAIKIFAIAYDVPDGSSVKALLYDCASTSKTGQKYYYDVQGDAIADAMASIGSEISELRIAK